jgi:glyoxylase-like metal-dependent hydrolase (beta-lactamase superfamily II)
MSITEARGAWDTRVRVFRSSDLDTFAVVTERFVVLVDTQMTPENCASILETLRPELQTRGLLVINSHQHDDHVWGNAALPAGTPIIALEASLVTANNPQFQTVLEEKRAADSRFANVRIVAPNLTFTDRMTLHGGDLTLELIPAPGHSPDQLVVWIPEIKTLLATDAAEHLLPYAGNAADLNTLRATLHNLETLEPEFVFPCHGETTDAGLLTRNIAYFDELERRVKAEESWAFEDVIAWMKLEVEAVDGFYQRFHTRNLEAMGALKPK